MKILHVGKYFPPYEGGMETYLRDLMVSQARHGIESIALVHQSEIGFRTEAESYQAGGQSLSVTRAAVWGRVIFTPISPTFPRLLSRLIKQTSPDILHLHMPNVSAFWALVLPCARRLPWIVHWHADVLASSHSFGLRLFYGLYIHFERSLLRRCETIIATSPTYLENSTTLEPYLAKCKVVPLGLDPIHKRHLQREFVKTDSTALRILAVGRLTYYKGFDYLIRASAETDNLTVRIVGRGELAKSLLRLTENLGVKDKVSFLGPLTNRELAEEYAACDCLCLPSIERSEAFGMVLLEAMYFGKALVISDVPGSGMSWIVDHGSTGLKVRPADAHALASAFRQLQDDRDSLKLFGINGRIKFDLLFHIDQSAAAIDKIYQQTLRAVSKASYKG